MTAVGLALAFAVLFCGMSVALRIALDRERDVMLGAFAIVSTALVVSLAWAAAEAPSRGVLRRIGLVYAFVTMIRFASRDNLVRWLAKSTAGRALLRALLRLPLRDVLPRACHGRLAARRD